MAVYKDQERDTWYAKFSYKDQYGNTRWTTKRGFKTPEGAKQYEIAFKSTSSGVSNMTFDTLLELYKEKYYPTFTPDTIRKKNRIVEVFILPYFSKRKLKDVSIADISQWKKIVEQSRNPVTGKRCSKRYVQSVFFLFDSILSFSTSF